MIQKIKTLLTTLTLSGMLFLPFGLVSVTVHAAATSFSPQTAICSGANLDVTNTCATTTGNNSSLNSVISFALNLFSIIVGIAAVIMIIVGGLKYVLSGGDSQKVSGAKDTILFAIVGLVVVALAQIIVHFVISGVTGATSKAGG